MLYVKIIVLFNLGSMIFLDFNLKSFNEVKIFFLAREKEEKRMWWRGRKGDKY